MPSRIKDGNFLLDIIENINGLFSHANPILGSFDIVDIFPNIDNKSGLKAVKSVLYKRLTNKPSVECILEDLKLCLTCNNSIFNNRIFLQTDGAAQGRHVSSRILKCLKLILQLYNIIFSQQSGKDFQIIFWQFGYMVLRLQNHILLS